MEIRHLKLVEAISKMGSLTKAANELYLTQSALSHQLKEIENQLGTQLFKRINKKMVFTEAGSKVLKSARIILNEIQNTEKEIRSLAEGETGIIRITTECYTSYHWLPKAMSIFNKKFPNIEISIEADATKRPIPALFEGKIDIGIVSNKSVEQTISYVPLFKDKLYLLVNKNNPLSTKRFIIPDDLKTETLLSYTIKDDEMDIFTRFLNPVGIKPQKVLKIQLTEAIIEMVKANVGVAVMAGWAIKPSLRSKELKVMNFKGSKLNRTWYAAVLKNQDIPQYYEEFIYALKSVSPES